MKPRFTDSPQAWMRASRGDYPYNLIRGEHYWRPEPRRDMAALGHRLVPYIAAALLLVVILMEVCYA